MSRHETKIDSAPHLTFVFGWDQPLSTFFLQIHDDRVHEEDNPVEWLGTKAFEMYDLRDITEATMVRGLLLDEETRTKLYQERDEGV